MKISNNMDVSSQYKPDKLKEANATAANGVQNNKENDSKEIGATLENKKQRQAIRTEEELDEIIGKIMKESTPIDNADAMIQAANANILKYSDDAILAQANNSAEKVSELLA